MVALKTAGLLLSLFLPLFGQKLTREEYAELVKTCGKEHKDHPTPWVASLAYSTKWYPGMMEEYRRSHEEHLCTATLISSRHVATAAHCLRSVGADCMTGTPEFALRNVERLRVYLGGRCSHPAGCLKAGRKETLVERSVKQAILPSFFYGNNECEVDPDAGNMLVLELDDDVVFSDRISPVCISNFTYKPPDYRFVGFNEKGTIDTTSFEASDIISEEDGIAVMSCVSNFGDGGTAMQMGRHSLLYVSGDCDIIATMNVIGYKLIVKLSAVARHLHWICLSIGICPQGYETVDMLEALPPNSRPTWFRSLGPLAYEHSFAA